MFDRRDDVAHPGRQRRFFCAVTTLAEEEREFAREFVAIKQRSRSLSPIDRDRLLRIVDCVDTELAATESYARIRDFLGHAPLLSGELAAGVRRLLQRT